MSAPPEPGRPGRRPAWAAFRAALDAAGFRPSKGRGQNFLVDTNMAAAIARDAGVSAGDRVLEIGPGCGFLSVHLAELGTRLLAVEIEPRLAAVAREFLAPYAGVEVLVADVLDGKHRLARAVAARLPAAGEPWHVVANLPYSIVGPTLAVLSRLDAPPATITVLVQRELAERVTAAPGDSAWSGLSAKLQARYRAELGRPVPAQLFSPRPRVESAVARLVLREDAPETAQLAAFDELVEALFQRRRKTLRAILAGVLSGTEEAQRLLTDLGIDPRARPGDLSVAALRQLAASTPWRHRRT